MRGTNAIGTTGTANTDTLDTLQEALVDAATEALSPSVMTNSGAMARRPELLDKAAMLVDTLSRFMSTRHDVRVVVNTGMHFSESTLEVMHTLLRLQRGRRTACPCCSRSERSHDGPGHYAYERADYNKGWIRKTKRRPRGARPR